MQDLVDVEGVLLAGAKAIDGLGHMLDELAEARLVIGRDQRAIGSALTLRSHSSIVPRPATAASRAHARGNIGPPEDIGPPDYPDAGTAFPPGIPTPAPLGAATAGAGNGTRTRASSARTPQGIDPARLRHEVG